MLEKILQINYYSDSEQNHSEFVISVRANRDYPEWARNKLHDYLNCAFEEWQNYIVKNESVENLQDILKDKLKVQA